MIQAGVELPPSDGPYDEELGPAYPEAGGLVAVFDRGARALAAVREALASCGLAARRVADVAELARLRRSAAGAMALVAVGDEMDPALVDAVSALKREGYAVICYRDTPGAWALGLQCRLLLAGAAEVLDGTGPGFARELAARLRRQLDDEAGRARDERRLRQQMAAAGVVGTGAAITDAFRWVQRASALGDLPVLINGETGTGKELVARALHRLDPRRARGPFVAVNCAAISGALAESELFGHRRGAFTGAEQERKGLVRAAHGGVLFLDEIGDLDLSLQGKLLRVLQERRVLALGHDEETPVDVRVVAATHRDLRAMVGAGTFRADLFHRLDVLALRMPALRERPEDVEPLVRHFMARGMGVPLEAAVASRDFVLAVQRLELPGNVRQLENLVRRCLVGWRAGDPLRLSDLPPELWLELAQLTRGADADGARPPGRAPADPPTPPAELVDATGVLEACSWRLEQALDLCERKIVDAALVASRGNRSRAAQLLGISPRSIFNKLRKHQLDV